MFKMTVFDVWISVCWRWNPNSQSTFDAHVTILLSGYSTMENCPCMYDLYNDIYLLNMVFNLQIVDVQGTPFFAVEPSGNPI